MEKIARQTKQRNRRRKRGSWKIKERFNDSFMGNNRKVECSQQQSHHWRPMMQATPKAEESEKETEIPVSGRAKAEFRELSLREERISRKDSHQKYREGNSGTEEDQHFSTFLNSSSTTFQSGESSLSYC
jgi:hypothetical protein